MTVSALARPLPEMRAHTALCSEANAASFLKFSLQFFNRIGVSKLHRVFHVPGVTEHLPPAEPDHRGNARATPAPHRQ